MFLTQKTFLTRKTFLTLSLLSPNFFKLSVLGEVRVFRAFASLFLPKGSLFQVTVKLRLHRGQRWVHWLGRSACVGPTTLSRGRPRGASGSPAGGRPAPGPPPTRPNPLLIWSPDPSATKSHLQACYKLYGSFKTF